MSPVVSTSTEPRAVGLIGIGLMGTVLAQRLLAAGYTVQGWDVDSTRREALRRLGGAVPDSAAAVARGVDRLLLSLPTHDIVAGVLGEMGAELADGSLVIDTSTGDPAAAERQATSLGGRGVAYLDATISGSSAVLQGGEAVFLVGGSAADFERCADLWRVLAGKVFHTGPVGSGARQKLVSNLVLGLNRAALAEGLVFAERLGLDPAQTLHLLRESLAYSKIMDAKGPKMLQREYTPQARLSQHLKDVRLMLASAGEAGLALPLSDAHRRILERAEELGWGESDNSALIEALRTAETTTSSLTSPLVSRNAPS
ncbi:MAG: NAD(P)-dependent oxidoreductase [Planctomycetaceae bacterium]|jgi:3-hydroxyisobutyrate dehydrogenase-like beta-hydroxyacid dehydrogenase